jgi:hypothetical protein
MEPPESVRALHRERVAIAQDLARPIAACVARRDTDHPAFHGCVDWHSSVHGVWALTAYSRATGDRQYDGLIKSVLTPDAIASERRSLKENPDFETPYGRAWFLRLGLEYKLRFGDNPLAGDLLTSMADDVFDSLMAFYEPRRINPASGSYQSDSWALINMYAYAESRRNEAGLRFLKDRIGKSFARDGAACQESWEGAEFMAVCANWAWLASLALSGDDLRRWADAFFKSSGLPRPVTAPEGWHAHGMNFSRAWGLWRLYRATGDERYAAAYAAHFRATYDRPGQWRGSYYGVAHWVPQFGVFALQPLFDLDGNAN